MRRILIGAAVAAGLLAAASGVSYGYYMSTGQGAGSATVGTMQVVALVAVSDAAPATPLLPGSTGEAVLELRNPNPFNVWLVQVQQSGPVVVTGGAGCTADNAAVDLAMQSGLHVAVASGNHAVLVRLPGAVTMGADAATACQGALFSIPVTVRVES